MDWRDFTYPGIVDKTTVSDALILTNIRARRDLLLTDSDWTQLADAPVDRALWAAYRKALRDLPASGRPRDIIFPNPPA